MGSFKQHMASGVPPEVAAGTEPTARDGAACARDQRDTAIVPEARDTTLEETVRVFELEDELERAPSYFVDSAEGVATYAGFDRNNGHRPASDALRARVRGIKAKYETAAAAEDPEGAAGSNEPAETSLRLRRRS